MQNQAVEIIDRQHFQDSYHFLAPSADLADYVICYWLLDMREPGFRQTSYNEVLLANMYSSLVINLGNPFELYNTNGQLLHSCNKSLLIGYHAATVSYRHLYSNYLVGVKFKPGALNYLFGVKGADMIKQAIPAGHVIDHITSTESRLYDAGNLPAMKVVLEQLIRHYLRKAYPDKPFDFVRRSFQEPVLVQAKYQLRKLASLLYLTPRTLERYFAQSLDIAPKKCMKILRFRHALDAYLKEGYKADWELLGYHDFSHFCKEWHELADGAPGMPVRPSGLAG
ncbi:helix-turn-helix domain-containing protein [Chitinophaga pendula]|uniref:DUF6597 domain-containing transcriptional factor n=1 Tax=Chitinophaga TaxID=79328 RepID=UPI000BAFE082|nr:MULTISPECIES: DUF6597 domain-containing transcriptional factor [Chitinophaga]ASZ09714.1 hypothetical protein CK934_01350 [Chitinophaga sp. MD30]UCJ07344.1 helix-turn-helix domain-containing protein [Chitinophaga pendula]